jgi:hypothetical protein
MIIEKDFYKNNLRVRVEKFLSCWKDSLKFAQVKGLEVSGFLLIVDRLNALLSDIFSDDPDKIVEGTNSYCEIYRIFNDERNACTYKDFCSVWDNLFSSISICINTYIVNEPQIRFNFDKKLKLIKI